MLSHTNCAYADLLLGLVNELSLAIETCYESL